MVAVIDGDATARQFRRTEMRATAETFPPFDSGDGDEKMGKKDKQAKGHKGETKTEETKGETQQASPEQPAAEPTTDAPAAEPTAPAADGAATQPAARGTVAHNLPEVGKVVEKRRRDGSVCGSIEIGEGGKVIYLGMPGSPKREEHKSLSAAALANSKDMNLKTKAIDGWAWWGLKDRKASGERAPRASNLPAKIEKAKASLVKAEGKVAELKEEVAKLEAALAAESAASQPAAAQPAA